MSDTVGKLSLVLTANASALNAGLNDAAKRVSGFIGNLSSMVSSIPGPLGAVLMVGKALTSVLGDTIDKLLSAKNAAHSLGMSNESFIGMSRAAEKLGIDSEALAVSLRHGAKAISEANGGSTQAQAAFRNLGINFQELKEQSPEQQFQSISASIMQIQNPADRVAASMAIFGRAGGQLLPLMEQGAEGIKKATDEAKKLGIALSDSDIMKLKDLKLAGLGKIKEQFEGLLVQIAIALSPLIKIISETFQAAVSAVMPILRKIATVIQVVVDRVGPIIKKIQDWLVKTISEAVEFITPIIDGIIEVFSAVMDIVEGLFEALEPVVTAVFETIGEVISSVADFFQPILEAIGFTSDGFTSFKDIVIDIFKAVVGAIGYFIDLCKMAAGFVLTYMITPIVGGFRLLLQGVTWVVKGLAKIPVFGKLFKGASEGLQTLTNQVRSTENQMRNTGQRLMATQFGDTRRTTDAFFENLRTRNRQAGAEIAANNPLAGIVDPKLLGDIQGFTDKLLEQIQTFGMSSDAVERWKLVNRGATDEMLSGVDALISKKKGMEEMKKMIEEGIKLEEEMRSPVEKFEVEMNRLEDMLANGIIDFQTFSRAAGKALDDVFKDAKATEMKMPKIELAGSASAISTINRSQLAGAGETRDNMISRIMQEQRDTQKIQVELARQTLRAIENQPEPIAA